MFHSIARKIVGPVFLLLGLLVALPGVRELSTLR